MPSTQEVEEMRREMLEDDYRDVQIENAMRTDWDLALETCLTSNNLDYEDIENFKETLAQLIELGWDVTCEEILQGV